MVAERTRSGGSCRVLEDDGPAFSGGDQLVAKKAEGRGVTELSNHVVAITGAQGLGGVFHDEEAVRRRERHQGLHIAGLPI